MLEYHTVSLWLLCSVRFVFVPPLPRDLADLKARIIAAVKNIDALMFARVCGKNLNIVSMCAVSPAVHTSNSCSCQTKNFFSFPVAVNNSINSNSNDNNNNNNNNIYLLQLDCYWG